MFIKRCVMMVTGILFIGICVGAYRLSAFGVDAFTCMNLGISGFRRGNDCQYDLRRLYGGFYLLAVSGSASGGDDASAADDCFVYRECVRGAWRSVLYGGGYGNCAL